MTKPRFQLTPEQYQRLTSPLDAARVGKNPKGFNHLEAWDIRRWLIRVFGFGSFDIETIALDLVKELEIPPGTIKYRNGGSNDKTIWTVVYRAQVRLTVYDQFGGHVVLEDGACGDSTNQPSLGDCHDNASKTALSQALKRCAVNLGDCFGLSLYNDGKIGAVVKRSLVAPAPVSADSTPAAELAVEDEPVRPEPGTAAAAEAAEQPPPPPDPNSLRDWALAKDRTADAVHKAMVRLVAQHPQIAATQVTNEHGDDEQLSVLLDRRSRELAGATSAPDQDELRRRTARMFALFRDLGYDGATNREPRHQIMSRLLGREITSAKQLTLADIETVIDGLDARVKVLRQQARHQANQQREVAA